MNCEFLVLSGFSWSGTRRGCESSEVDEQRRTREEIRGRGASAPASFGRYSFEEGVRVALANLASKCNGPASHYRSLNRWNRITAEGTWQFIANYIT